MIKIGNELYRLCLLDTNVLSEIIRNKNNERSSFITNFSISNGIIPCFSIWSVIELRKAPDIYKDFIKFFSIVPCCLLKPYIEILGEEYTSYQSGKKANPVLNIFTLLDSGERRLEKIISTLFKKREIRKAEKSWNRSWKKEILDSILELKPNFSPNKKFFNSQDAKIFIKTGIPQYIAKNNYDFYQCLLTNENELNINRFPAIKMLFYTVFYRFYAEKRDPEIQDIFDLMISCILPYLDLSITEKFQAEITGKIKRIDPFLNHIEEYSLKNLKN